MRIPFQFTAILFFGALLSFTKPASLELQGKVVNAETGLPVSGAYLYTVEGEEEVLTSKNGEFKFTTWRPFPFVLTVQHQDYQKQQWRITGTPKPLEIKLKKKTS